MLPGYYDETKPFDFINGSQIYKFEEKSIYCFFFSATLGLFETLAWAPAWTQISNLENVQSKPKPKLWF